MYFVILSETKHIGWGWRFRGPVHGIEAVTDFRITTLKIKTARMDFKLMHDTSRVNVAHAELKQPGLTAPLLVTQILRHIVRYRNPSL